MEVTPPDRLYNRLTDRRTDRFNVREKAGYQSPDRQTDRLNVRGRTSYEPSDRQAEEETIAKKRFLLIWSKQTEQKEETNRSTKAVLGMCRNTVCFCLFLYMSTATLLTYKQYAIKRMRTSRLRDVQCHITMILALHRMFVVCLEPVEINGHCDGRDHGHDHGHVPVTITVTITAAIMESFSLRQPTKY